MWRFRRRHGEFSELGSRLRSSRPEPRPEFLRALVSRSHEDARFQPRLRRARPGGLRRAFAVGLTGALLTALASVGGIGYAASSASDAVDAVQEAVSPGVQPASNEPSHDQYQGKNCGNPEHGPHPRHADKPCPIASGNSAHKEGAPGQTKNFQFPVTLGATPVAPVTVEYVTTDGTATVANNDYRPTSGVLLFYPGDTLETVTVEVVGDAVRERNETFYIRLLNPSENATIVDGEGQGTIQNDD